MWWMAIIAFVVSGCWWRRRQRRFQLWEMPYWSVGPVGDYRGMFGWLPRKRVASYQKTLLWGMRNAAARPSNDSENGELSITLEPWTREALNKIAGGSK